MAVKTLDELLATLTGPEKALFENTLKTNPELKEGWLRQDDFSRKQNELKARQAEYDEEKAYNVKMTAWADETVPKWEKLQTAGIIGEDGEELWTGKQTELERQLAEARAQAVGGEDMDPKVLRANIEAIMKDFGPMTKEEMAAVAAGEARKLAAETFDTKYAEKEISFNEKTIPFVTGFSTSMALAAAKYERETGKDFTDEDTKAVFALMARDKNYDPRKAVGEYMAPHLKAKTDEEEVEKRVQARLAEERSKRGLPGAGEEALIPQGDQKGNLRLMLERSAATEGDVESVIAAQAVKAAAALHSDGK